MIELIDIGFRTLKYWYKKKLESTYRKHAISCDEIQLSDYEINQAVLDIHRKEQEKREKLLADKKLIPVVEYVKDKKK